MIPSSLLLLGLLVNTGDPAPTVVSQSATSPGTGQDMAGMQGMAPAPRDQAPPNDGATDPMATDPAMAMVHHHAPGQLGDYPGTRDASGTAWQPDSAAHDGLHRGFGAWTAMAHGEATLIYDNQGGPRGRTETFVLSHLTLAVERPLGGGTLTLKGLFSLDPLIGAQGYPLLLQTGETANGRTPLIDRQHPHDLIGELAAAYSHPLAPGVSAFAYGGPAGEPALGPPVYLHRAAGMADPETPLDHHWLDSTHLVFGVVTGGLVAGGWKIEVSGFKGREPDQHRWDIETPAIDSWSTRVSWNPGRDWSLQVSTGRLHSVEQLEPAIDQQRTTASAIYNRPFKRGYWQTVVAWGRLHELPPPGGQRTTSDAYLVESTLKRGADTVFGRFENVSKDELFTAGSPYVGELFNVSKLSLGYQRTVALPIHLAADFGGLFSKYGLPRRLDPFYGADPNSFMLFTRLHLRG